MKLPKKLVSGTAFTSIGTLVSRILGLLREMMCANLWGMSSGIMDAFVLALRIPFFFRRLFSEGVLGISYIPVLSYEIAKAQKETIHPAEEDRKNQEADYTKIWKIVSTVFTFLVLILSGLVLLAEGVCLAIMFFRGEVPATQDLFLKLLMISLPSALLICLIAQLASTLQAFHRFLIPTFPPIFINAVILIQLCTITIHVTDPYTQAIIVTVGMTTSGLFPILFLWFSLWRGNGLRFHFDYSGTKYILRRILHGMLPMMLGLMIIPLNAMISSLIAWMFSAPNESTCYIWWLPGHLEYPLCQGAVSALALGERIYQFPLGLLGIPVAITIFPMLSRVAATGNITELSQLLTRGLCMTLFWAIPGSVGLMFIVTPLVNILFQHGEFSHEDSLRVGHMAIIFSSACWAFCLLPVLIRGFYILGDRQTPMRIGAYIAGMNILLNLLLIWFFAESGLAISVTILAIIHVFWLAFFLHYRLLRLSLPLIALRTFRCITAVLVMTGVCFLPFMQNWLASISTDGEHFYRLVSLLLYIVTAGSIYLFSYWIIKGFTFHLEKKIGY
ncbi:MAG: murein biosynthesis integral membrane protein MurJ [Planctomycetia bacterium]|nr:murein biosynthesis integral membrane protein MurJ [Planctomycetia bacterium]